MAKKIKAKKITVQTSLRTFILLSNKMLETTMDDNAPYSASRASIREGLRHPGESVVTYYIGTMRILYPVEISGGMKALAIGCQYFDGVNARKIIKWAKASR
jgi:hypothetical protein